MATRERGPDAVTAWASVGRAEPGDNRVAPTLWQRRASASSHHVSGRVSRGPDEQRRMRAPRSRQLGRGGCHLSTTYVRKEAASSVPPFLDRTNLSVWRNVQYDGHAIGCCMGSCRGAGTPSLVWRGTRHIRNHGRELVRLRRKPMKRPPNGCLMMSIVVCSLTSDAHRSFHSGVPLNKSMSSSQRLHPWSAPCPHPRALSRNWGPRLTSRDHHRAPRAGAHGGASHEGLRQEAYSCLQRDGRAELAPTSFVTSVTRRR